MAWEGASRVHLFRARLSLRLRNELNRLPRSRSRGCVAHRGQRVAVKMIKKTAGSSLADLQEDMNALMHELHILRQVGRCSGAGGRTAVSVNGARSAAPRLSGGRLISQRFATDTRVAPCPGAVSGPNRSSIPMW